MMDKITCPNCSHKFDIEDTIAKELEVTYNKQLAEEKAKLHHQYQNKQQELNAKEVDFQAKKEKANELFKQRLDKALLEKEGKLKNQLSEEFQLKLTSQEKELNEKQQKIRALQEKEIEFAKMQRKMEEMGTEMELKFQKNLLEEQKKIEEKASIRIADEYKLKMLERDKQLEDQKKLIEEMRRKSEQGSMQLQGEVQEQAIEHILQSTFPYDQIEEVAKGVRGADCVQTVIENQRTCGKIVYESKRTKVFGAEWINKLKSDQRAVQAEIAVLVTQTMPKDMAQFGEKNGVYICTFEEFKSLAYVLRQILIRMSDVKSAQENKGDKMEMLYSFLTSEEFRMQFTGILDAFNMLKGDLDKEKRAMQSLWKKREKQLENVITNTIDMYGSIKGIAGKAIPTVSQLELSDGEDETNDHS